MTVESSSVENPRKKKKGARPIYWIGTKGGELVQVQAATLTAAQEEVDEVHFGPFHRFKGLDKGDQNGVSVTLQASDVRYTGNNFSGVFQGWKFVANGLKGVVVDGEEYGDDDLLVPMFTEPASASSKSSKPRIKSGAAIRAEDADDVVPAV